MNATHLHPARRTIAAILLASTCLISSGPAFAQVAGAETSDYAEIIVTATKRNESIQKVPISLQALSNEMLSQHQVTGLDDYVKLLPSVSFQTYGPSQSDISIRGVSTGGINLPGGSLPTVGIYLDEVPVSTIGAMLDVHAYDMARVEVLSGPQGTLYGASSLSGTIRLITNKPKRGVFEGGYDMTLNKFGEGKAGGVAEGFVNTPLGEKAALRIVGFYQRDGGYIDNTPGTRNFILSDTDPTTNLTVNNAAEVNNNFNSVETYGGRVALGIDLDDNWTATPAIIAQHQKAKGAFGFDPRVGDLEVHEYAPDRNLDKWFQAALTIEGKIGNFDLLYSGGYLKRSINNDQDYSYYTVYYDALDTYYTNFPDGNGGFLDPSMRYHNEQRLTKQSHELRLSSDQANPFSFTAGLFYQRQSNKNLADYMIPGFGSIPDTFAVFGDDIFVTDTHITTRDYAAFGEANYKITEDLKLTGGIRVFKAHNTLTGFSGFASNAAAVGCAVPITRGSCSNIDKTYKESGETHKVSLSWQVDPNRMVYATYSTGFRPGGNNRRPGINPYDADTIDNFEIGWKTSWLDRRLRFNGAIYHMKWKKLQYTLAPVGSAGVVNIYNSGDARINGAEFDVQFRSGGLTLSGTGTFTDAKLTTPFCQINAAGNSDCTLGTVAAPKGTRLTAQPKFKGTATARYDFDLRGRESFVQASMLHQGGVRNFLATADDLAVGRTKGFTTFDFSAGTKFGELSVEAFIQNAFDKRGILSRNTFCPATICGSAARSYPIKPQLFGLKVSQRF